MKWIEFDKKKPSNDGYYLIAFESSSKDRGILFEFDLAQYVVEVSKFYPENSIITKSVSYWMEIDNPPPTTLMKLKIKLENDRNNAIKKALNKLSKEEKSLLGLE